MPKIKLTKYVYASSDSSDFENTYKDRLGWSDWSGEDNSKWCDLHSNMNGEFMMTYEVDTDTGDATLLNIQPC